MQKGDVADRVGVDGPQNMAQKHEGMLLEVSSKMFDSLGVVLSASAVAELYVYKCDDSAIGVCSVYVRGLEVEDTP